MPNISMCKGGNCPRKDSCYRYTAIAPGDAEAARRFMVISNAAAISARDGMVAE